MGGTETMSIGPNGEMITEGHFTMGFHEHVEKARKAVRHHIAKVVDVATKHLRGEKKEDLAEANAKDTAHQKEKMAEMAAHVQLIRHKAREALRKEGKAIPSDLKKGVLQQFIPQSQAEHSDTEQQIKEETKETKDTKHRTTEKLVPARQTPVQRKSPTIHAATSPNVSQDFDKTNVQTKCIITLGMCLVVAAVVLVVTVVMRRKTSKQLAHHYSTITQP